MTVRGDRAALPAREFFTFFSVDDEVTDTGWTINTMWKRVGMQTLRSARPTMTLRPVGIRFASNSEAPNNFPEKKPSATTRQNDLLNELLADRELKGKRRPQFDQLSKDFAFPGPAPYEQAPAPSSDLLQKGDLSTQMEANAFRNLKLPRTGTLAGRTVAVSSQFGLQSALRQLNSINRSNNINRIVVRQRAWERPGKKKQRLRMEKAQRDFAMGVRKLFKLVSEARKKGY